MGDVLHKTATPTDYRISVHTPNFDSATWFINPDISAVVNVPTKYWKRPLTDPVQEMSPAEKQAVDDAEKTRVTQNERSNASGASDDPAAVGMQNRSLIEVFNQRDNYLVNRVSELQDTLRDIKQTSGAADNIRAAIPDNFLATATRDRSDAVAQYQLVIDSGGADAQGGTKKKG